MWILICCIIIAVIIITIAKTKTTKLTKMSFKEALDLTEVPIITFYNRWAFFYYERKENIMNNNSSNINVNINFKANTEAAKNNINSL